MALNDEIKIEASTSKRSQTTGHLLIVMPKLLVGNSFEIESKSTNKVEVEKFGKCVDLRTIFVDEREVPPLM